MVFTDDDGQSYLYWGQGVARVVPLNADMVSFDPAQVRTITPSGYNEAPFVFKRNGTYYFMWSENDTRSEDYRVAYATGTSPLGPWTNRGVVLQKRLDAGHPGHRPPLGGAGARHRHLVHRLPPVRRAGRQRHQPRDRHRPDAVQRRRHHPPIVPTL